MSLEGIKVNLLAKALAAGCKSAPTNPPEATNSFPFAICYDRTGELTGIMGGYTSYDQVKLYLDVHVARNLLPKSVALAETLRDPILQAIIGDPTLGAQIANLDSVSWQFGRMDYNDIITVGYRFEIQIKVRLYAH